MLRAASHQSGLASGLGACGQPSPSGRAQLLAIRRRIEGLGLTGSWLFRRISRPTKIAVGIGVVTAAIGEKNVGGGAAADQLCALALIEGIEMLDDSPTSYQPLNLSGRAREAARCRGNPGCLAGRKAECRG